MKACRLALVLLPLLFLTACVTASRPVQPRPASEAEAVDTNVNLGTRYIQDNRPDLAIGPLQRAVGIDDRHAGAQLALAIAYDQQGRVDDAEQHYRRAADLNRVSGEPANAYAVFLCRQGRWNDAEPYFQRAIEAPEYRTPVVAMTNAGVCARSAGDRDKANQYFRSALSRNTSAAEPLVGLMELEYEDGNYMSARAFVQRYLFAQPAVPSVLRICVLVERALENEDDAQECALQLGRDFPGSPEFISLQQLGADATGR